MLLKRRMSFVQFGSEGPGESQWWKTQEEVGAPSRFTKEGRENTWCLLGRQVGIAFMDSFLLLGFEELSSGMMLGRKAQKQQGQYLVPGLSGSKAHFFSMKPRSLLKCILFFPNILNENVQTYKKKLKEQHLDSTTQIHISHFAM